MGVSEDDDSDHTSDCTGWAAQRISTAFMTALVGVIHDQARHQQTSLTLPFRTTVHTVADLYCISWESQLGIGHQARTGFEAPQGSNGLHAIPGMAFIQQSITSFFLLPLLSLATFDALTFVPVSDLVVIDDGHRFAPLALCRMLKQGVKRGRWTTRFVSK